MSLREKNPPRPTSEVGEGDCLIQVSLVINKNPKVCRFVGEFVSLEELLSKLQNSQTPKLLTPRKLINSELLRLYFTTTLRPFLI